MGFKYEDSAPEYKTMLKSLLDIHDSIHGNPDKNVVELYGDLHIPHTFIKALIHANKTIANRHQKQISLINDFVDSQNYFGDAFVTHREKQIAATDYWTTMYLHSVPKHKEISDHLHKLTDSIIENNAQMILHAKY